MFKVDRSIFREYDIRGIAKEQLTPEFATLLGRTYAQFAKRRLKKSSLKISIGKDCRLTSDSLAAALVKGLTQSGINVVTLGTCPTPLTYFSIYHLGLDGGIMVTGSHNPAEYNGFKICVGKDTIHGEDIQELYKMMSAGDFAEPATASTSAYEIIPAYVDYVVKDIKSSAPSLRSLKVVIDAGNGTAGTVAPVLFEKLGANVIPLYTELDGRFPNHHPDPTVHENLTELVSLVKKNHADVGVAFDGDSDRIGVVDETGRIVYGDELMVILSREVLLKNPGATIISEVKSSHRLYEDIAKKGGIPLMWKTGHSLIKSKLRETKAALAGEMSGHIFFNDRYFGYDDAIYSAARLYEILGKGNHTVSSLYQDLTPVVATPEIRLDCDEDKKFALVESVSQLLKPKFKTTDIDGVRVDFGDSWGLLRASNTQPVLVLRFEAPTSERLKEIRGIIESALRTSAEKTGHARIV